MKKIAFIAALLFAASACTGPAADNTPFSLHPDNPRYFMFRGNPAVIVTSGEHYGVLANRAFDPDKYLETLHGDGLNCTRVFMGAYIEPDGAFNIIGNTLAPSPEDYVSPWSRSAENAEKFDLTEWNPEYFARLHRILRKASELDIILELNLFCPMYEDMQWEISPMNARNNINGIGDIERTKVYTLDGDSALLGVQEALVRKIVSETNSFDNLYFEICNEPYFGGVTQEWQKHITDVITETEKNLGRRHLISVNVANGSAAVTDPHPDWSIFNFHYCSPPDAVAMNAHLNRPVGMNETGFNGTEDAYYRREAWCFMMSGGALYNNLDYSFTAGKEDGTNVVVSPTPGGGSPALRKQLGAMRRFIESHDFTGMSPAENPDEIILSDSEKFYILCESGKQYALYSPEVPRQITMNLPAGKYLILALDPCSLAKMSVVLTHDGGPVTREVPAGIGNELAISVTKIIHNTRP